MNGFEDRKRAFEKKYELDAETQFKVDARTAKLFGLWAAEHLGIKGAEAENYAVEVAQSDLQKAGQDDVVEKVEKDLKDKGITSYSHHQLQRELEACRQKAVEQIKGK